MKRQRNERIFLIRLSQPFTGTLNSLTGQPFQNDNDRDFLRSFQFNELLTVIFNVKYSKDYFSHIVISILVIFNGIIVI